MVSFRELFDKLRPANLRRRQVTFSAAAVDVTTYEYAAAIYTSMADLILSAIKKTEWRLEGGSPYDWAGVRLFLQLHGDEIVGRMMNEGRVAVSRTDDGTGLWEFTREGATADYVFESSDYRLRGLSTYSIIRPCLDYLNAIVNAANTTISRLGVLAIFSPKQSEYGNTLTPEELQTEEQRLQEDYGVLSAQKVVKFFSHSYDLNVVNIAGENLQLTDRFTQAVKMISGKLKIPFELVPCATLGNQNQTGVYQGEAVKRLYQTVAEWQTYLTDFCRSQGFTVSAVNPDAPADYALDAEERIANLSAAVAAGFITQEEAAARYQMVANN